MLGRASEAPWAGAPAPRSRTGRWALGLLAGLALASTSVSSLAAQISARPVIIHFPAGRSAAETGIITNEGDVPLQLRLYRADYRQKIDGSHAFQEIGSHERSCADRLSVFPDGATVAPGESLEARIEMEPGPRTCWSLVFVETVQADTVGVHIGQRIGMKVYGLGEGASRSGEMRSVTASRSADSVRVSFVVRNTGEVPFRPRGRIEIRTPSGETVQRTEIDPFSVLPGSERRYDVRWPTGLRVRRYLVLPLLDIGAEYLLGGQAFLEPEGAREQIPARNDESA